MLSGRLIRSIEENWEELAERLIGGIRRHADMETLAARSDAELREWCQLTVENLAYWLAGGHEEEVKRRYEVAGRERFEEGVPLHETVLRCQMFKDIIVNHVYDRLFPVDSLQLYAAEELERGISRFFDSRVYHLIRGYEKAVRSAALYA